MRDGRVAQWHQVLKRDTWVLPYFRRYRKVLASALGLGLVAAVFACGLMFTSGYLISAAAEQPWSVFELMVPLGFVQIFGIGKPFLGYLERLRSHDWVLRMTSDLRRRLYASVERTAGAAARRTGEMLGLLADDVAHVQNLYLRAVFPTIIAWGLWLVAVAALGVFSVAFALAMGLALLVCVTLAPLVSVLVNGARHMREKDLRATLYDDLADHVLGADDLALSGRGATYVAHVGELVGRLGAERDVSHAFARRRDLLVQLMFGLLVVCLLVWAAGRFGQVGVVGASANLIAAFVVGFFPLIETFAPLPAAAEDATESLASIRRLNGLTDPGDLPLTDEPRADTFAQVVSGGLSVLDSGPSSMPSEPVPSAVHAQDASAQTSFSDVTQPPLIELASVHLIRPSSSTEAIRGIGLVVKPGEHVAVLGPSGAGKSTLLAIIRGDLAPTSGAVLVDGEPACELGDRAAQIFGVVQQDTFLFDDTLLANLALAKPDITEDEARDALDRVGLGPLLARLPKGLATLVGEAGANLSGGERHRVALARVLLQQAPIVLLDEPFAGLDPATESQVLGTLLDVFAGRTLILVTHHLLGIERMDRVVFLEDGAIALQGSPAELEAASPRYRDLLAFDRGW